MTKKASENGVAVMDPPEKGPLVPRESMENFLKIRLNSQSSLLMHNSRLSNPLNNYAKELKKITGKRKKTEEDYLNAAKVEFLGGLYYDEDIGPYIPGQNIDAMIRDGAKLLKLGTTVERGVIVQEERIPLKYTGPRDPEKLFNGTQSKFVDMRSVVVGCARVTRTRPIFHVWELDFSLIFHADLINREDVLRCLQMAGKFTGMGDGRPRYGKFSFSILEDTAAEAA